MFDTASPTPLIQLDHTIFQNAQLTVWFKRDDLIDKEISGSKWRKLKYNLIEARRLGYQRILTFGGAYSNHIAATASACKRFGFESIGIIRGEELHPKSNATLEKAQANGMDLQFISRTNYRKRADTSWLKSLEEKYQAFMVPEGGSNPLALRGVAEILQEIDHDFDRIICPVGTGGTLAGLAKDLEGNQKALGICCLKGADYLARDIYNLVGSKSRWSLEENYHFGGYAKFDGHLIKFINEFKNATGVPLDPVYTGKMMFGLFDLIKKGAFEKGSKLICLHTGGLQGIAGFNDKHNHLLDL